MNPSANNRSQPKTWSWRLAVAVAATLVTLAANSGNSSALLGITSTSSTTTTLTSTTTTLTNTTTTLTNTLPLNINQAVLNWSNLHPGEPIPVVIESSGDTQSLLSAIDLLGGTVERNFQIIPAVQTELTLSSILSLADDPSVSWISLDAPVVNLDTTIDSSNLASTYPASVSADVPWSLGYTGAGVTVAVVDTGISPRNHQDFSSPDGTSRVVAEVDVSKHTNSTADGYGHGTHVAGIIGGDGSASAGKYIGIAPNASLINVKVADDDGNAAMSDVIAGLEWVYNNRTARNIRIVNMSLHSSVAQSYETDPLCTAAEIVWFSGVFVVAAAGNLGNASDAVNYCPSNDPFVMTVGATDTIGTVATGDDVVASFSSRGTTQDGFAKPEIVAPGRNMVSVVDTASQMYAAYPDKIVDGNYFRLSGTSMAAPVVSGIAALMLQHNPALTPPQIKHILVNSAQPLMADPNARLVSANGAVFFSGLVGDSNEGLSPSHLLRESFAARMGMIVHVLGATDPVAEAGKVGLDLNAVGATNLSNIQWEAVKWSSVKWDAVKWSAVKWDAVKWSAVKWDAVKWSAVKWDAIKWGAVKWDAVKWSAIKWDAVKWDAIKWDAIN